MAILGIAAVVERGSLYPKSISSLAFPDLVLKVFPPAFTSFVFAAVVVGSIVPASIMALASANLLTRNLYLEYINKGAPQQRQAFLSRILVFVVIVAALAFSLVPAASGDIIYLQTMGGAFILQTLPAVYMALFTDKLNKYAVGLGWAAGMVLTVVMLFQVHLVTSLYGPLGDIYIGIFALVVNLGVVGLGQAIAFAMGGQAKPQGNIDNRELVPQE